MVASRNSKKVFSFLSKQKRKIPNSYFKELKQLDKLEGNDSISNRIANVRTWSYVANKSNGLKIVITGLREQKFRG